jgi:hypothetical protein
MATVVGLTSTRMLEIADASIVGGTVNALGNLILTTQGGTTIDAGPITAAGLIGQYYRGDKTWATLDKTAVGLPLVDNVSVLTDYVGKWKPGILYMVGSQAISPYGEIVRAISTHVSGSSYTATNWTTNPLVVRTNYITNPSAEVDTTGWTVENGATFTRDTSAPLSGLASFKHSTGGDVYQTTAAAAGDYWTLSATYQTSGTVAGTPKLYLAQVGGSAPNASTILPLTQASPTVFSVTIGPLTAGATNITAGLYAPTSGGIVWFDDILLEKSTVPIPTPGSFFSGATATVNELVCAWTGTANASTSTMTAVPNGFMQKWRGNRSYTAGDQVALPTGQVTTSKTTRTSRATFDSTEAQNWSGGDLVMSFINAGFAWSGSGSNWDAGPLSISASSDDTSQISSGVAFASPGGLSGEITLNEPGIYDAVWDIAPSADPGNGGYRIVTSSGAWPGPPNSGNGSSRLGQINRMAGQYYWESKCVAVGIRVPAAGLSIRFTGLQANGTTNVARIKIIKRGSI